MINKTKLVIPEKRRAIIAEHKQGMHTATTSPQIAPPKPTNIIKTRDPNTIAFTISIPKDIL